MSSYAQAFLGGRESRRQDRELAMREEAFARQKEREDASRGAYQALARPETRGVDMPQRQVMVKDPNATPDVEPGAGGEITPGPKMDDPVETVKFNLFQNPARLADPKFLNAAADEFLKRGLPEGVKWLEQAYKVEKEGGISAMIRLAEGDVDGAVQLYNSRGQGRIDRSAIQPVEGQPGSYDITTEQGTQRVNPRAVVQSLLSPEQWITRKDRAQQHAETLEQRSNIAQQNREALERRAAMDRDARTADRELAYFRGLELQRMRDEAAQKRVETQQQGATERRAMPRAGGGGGGDTGKRVHSRQTNADGSVTILFRDGTSRTMTREDGERVIAKDREAEEAARIHRAGKGLTTPAEARDQAKEVLGTKPTYREGATATNPSTGEKMVFKGGKWVKQ